MIDFALLTANPDYLKTMTPFVVSLRVKRLSRCNFLVTFVFVYHDAVTVRLTGSNSEWLIFFNPGHLLSYLSRHGLQQMAVSYD